MTTETLNVLNALANKLNLKEETFYAVTLRPWGIDFQGYMDTDTFQIARQLGIELKQHPTNSWFSGDIMYEGVHIKLCLTIG